MPSKDVMNKDAVKRAEAMLKLHQQIRSNIEKQNEKYKEKADRGRKERIFQPGDLVWIHLRKERFPASRKNKLMPRADGPFRIVERVNNNAYKINLPGDYGVSATFNVQDLAPYEDDEGPLDLRTNLFQQRGNDAKQIRPMNTLNMLEWIAH